MNAEYGKLEGPRDFLVDLRETSVLLLLWSLLIINEGCVRLLDQNPADGLDISARILKLLAFIGGVFEIILGLLGFIVGIGAYFMKWYSTTFTKVCMAIQWALGWYVFCLFVFGLPAIRATDLQEPVLEGLSLGQSRFLITLGIFTSFHLCLSLQGGQFIFFARLVATATHTDYLRQESGERNQAIFWNVNLALFGIWTFITGVLIRSNVGAGKLQQPFFSPPNVGLLPGLTIFTGILMTSYGLLGIAMVFKNISPLLYFMGAVFVYIVALLNFGVLQFGFISNPPSGAVAMQNGLIFMVIFMAIYFVHKCYVQHLYLLDIEEM